MNQSAQIVLSPVFESGVVKIQDAREQHLATPEKRAVCGLLLEQSGAAEAVPALDSVVERRMKRLTASVTTAKSEYKKNRYQLPTAKNCERMFSIERQALTNRRREIFPQNF